MVLRASIVEIASKHWTIIVTWFFLASLNPIAQGDWLDCVPHFEIQNAAKIHNENLSLHEVLRIKSTLEAIGEANFKAIMAAMSSDDLNRAGNAIRFNLLTSDQAQVLASQAGLPEFILALYEFNQAFTGVLHRPDGYQMSLQLLGRMSANVGSGANISSSLIDFLPTASRLIQRADWLKVELLQRASGEHAGVFPTNRPGRSVGGFERAWREFSLYMAPHNARAQRLIGFLETVQKIALRQKWVDELALDMLPPDQAADFLFDTRAEFLPLAQKILEVFKGPAPEGRPYTIEDFGVIPSVEINLWASDRRLARINQVEMVGGNDDQLINDLERMVALKSSGVVPWALSQHPKRFLLIETGARERTIGRLSRRYGQATDVETGESYSYTDVTHVPEYETVSDGKGGTTTRFKGMKAVYTYHTVEVTFENHLANHWPTGSFSTDDYSRFQTASSQMVQKERPHRRRIAEVEAFVSQFFDQYANRLQRGTLAELSVQIANLIAGIDATIADLRPYVEMGQRRPEDVVGQYNRDTVENFLARNQTNLLRLLNLKRLLLVLEELARRQSPELTPTYFLLDVNIPMASLARIDTNIRIQQLFGLALIGTGVYFGAAPPDMLPAIVEDTRQQIGAQVSPWVESFRTFIETLSRR